MSQAKVTKSAQDLRQSDSSKELGLPDLSWQCKHRIEGRYCPLCPDWQPIKANQYYYQLTNTGYGSSRYGNCEVCDKPVETVFFQVERRGYTRPDRSVGLTTHDCYSKFGHKECLTKTQRQA